MSTSRKLFRHVGAFVALSFLTIAMSGSAGATAANTDVTDIWWNPSKSGNGYQLVNTGTFVFATAYLYGPDRKPFWISAELDLTGAAQATYTGPLYVSSGPYFGGTYNPDTVVSRQAGTMTFVLTSVSTGQISYTIDGVVSNESVQRQPLTLDFYGGSYKVFVTTTASGCASASSNGVSTFSMDMDILQSGGQMQQVWHFDGGDCTFAGNYTQLGRMGTFASPGSSTPACSAKDSLIMFQMTNEPYTFMARFNVSGGPSGCFSDGELVGVIPR